MRDAKAESEAFEREPLQDYGRVQFHSQNWSNAKLWRATLPAAPRLMRAITATERVAREQPTEGSMPTLDPKELTRAMKEFAAAIGLSAVGVAQHDPKYTFAPHQGQEVGDRVIVCVLEQNWATVQKLPSAAAEQVALSTFAEVLGLQAKLAKFIQLEGYRANPQVRAHGVIIHYAVAAGLGQLGLNGQLLTPAAGSRVRMVLIDTDAPLVLDHPIDYGVHGICDACKACVRRCPSGAIPATRRMYRGIMKAKINTARCAPVVAQASACNVCTRVCPVQRYGLAAVVEEFARSGTVLGKGTDDLEGYDWPIDGEHYGPGQRPSLDPGFFNPPGAHFDFTRKLPLASDREKSLIIG